MITKMEKVKTGGRTGKNPHNAMTTRLPEGALNLPPNAARSIERTPGH